MDEITTPTTEPTIAELREQIAALQRQVTDQQDLTARAESKHREDIATIGERLMSEASDRNWCGEYDEVVERLNRDLWIALPVRERDYTVQVMVRLSINVTATNEDDAKDKARDIVREVEQHADRLDGTTSYPDDSYEWEIEEA